MLLTYFWKHVVFNTSDSILHDARRWITGIAEASCIADYEWVILLDPFESLGVNDEKRLLNKLVPLLRALLDVDGCESP